MWARAALAAVLALSLSGRAHIGYPAQAYLWQFFLVKQDLGIPKGRHLNAILGISLRGIENRLVVNSENYELPNSFLEREDHFIHSEMNPLDAGSVWRQHQSTLGDLGGG